MTNLVLSSAEYIASRATHVHLGNDSKFESAAAIIGPRVRGWTSTSWTNCHLVPSAVSTPSMKAMWIFLIDTLNFGFWTAEGEVPFTVSDGVGRYTGYWSLCAALKRACDESVPILEATFWASSTATDWGSIFRSETSSGISLLERRVSVVNEAGRFLRDQFSGSVYEMIRSCENSAQRVVEVVRRNLESYRDESEYGGRVVYFLKRAQILAADLHFGLAADEDGVCKFEDICELTMFADYRVPQGLNYFGLIEYSDWLNCELRSRPHLKSGSEVECEIRGLSIVAIEKLKGFIGPPAISVVVDYVMWDYTKEHEDEMRHIPIHKTRGIFY
jgi:hypothetical protein